MQAQDVLEVLYQLETAGVAVWLDGGWGIDALVDMQTRPHRDVDIIIPLDQVSLAQHTLRLAGYAVTEDALPRGFVMRNAKKWSIDFHPVTFDQEGNGLQQLEANVVFTYPHAGFAGVGYVWGRAVRCLTAEVQVLCHLGYEPTENDFHDMQLLQTCFNITLPAPYINEPAEPDFHDMQLLQNSLPALYSNASSIPTITTLAPILREAGAILRDGFEKVQQGTGADGGLMVEHKANYSNLAGSVVTVYDKQVEDLLVDRLQNILPGSGFISEELGTRDLQAEYIWVMDPLDGTLNFSRGIAPINISVALIAQTTRGGASPDGTEEENTILLAAVYNPLTDELYNAAPGEGAWLNGRRLVVSAVSNLTEAIFFSSSLEKALSYVQPLIGKIGHFRLVTSTAYDGCQIAAGRAEAMFKLIRGPHDIAANALLIREAGGLVTTLAGRPWTIHDHDVLLSNGKTHAALLEILSRK